MARACSEGAAGIWAIVPVKPLAQAKTRLAQVLAPVAREALVLRLLEHTLQVLAQVEALAGVLVVSADARVGSMAQALGALWLHEPDAPGLNRSLARAVEALQPYRASGALVIPADLPHLNAPSVLAVLAAGGNPPAAVLVADRHYVGTNALLLLPPTAIPFAFGVNSLHEHQRLAQAAGVRVVCVDDPDLATDVDLPEDLAAVVFEA